VQDVAQNTVASQIPQQVCQEADHCQTTIPQFSLGVPAKQKCVAVFAVVCDRNGGKSVLLLSGVFMVGNP
jgi:hypothetical protein